MLDDAAESYFKKLCVRFSSGRQSVLSKSGFCDQSSICCAKCLEVSYHANDYEHEIRESNSHGHHGGN